MSRTSKTQTTKIAKKVLAYKEPGAVSEEHLSDTMKTLSRETALSFKKKISN